MLLSQATGYVSSCMVSVDLFLLALSLCWHLHDSRSWVTMRNKEDCVWQHCYFTVILFFVFLVVHTTAIGKPTVAQIPNGNYVFFINFAINYINNDNLSLWYLFLMVKSKNYYFDASHLAMFVFRLSLRRQVLLNVLHSHRCYYCMFLSIVIKYWAKGK